MPLISFHRVGPKIKLKLSGLAANAFPTEISYWLPNTFKENNLTGPMAHTYDPSLWEAEAVGSPWVQGQSDLTMSSRTEWTTKYNKNQITTKISPLTPQQVLCVLLGHVRVQVHMDV